MKSFTYPSPMPVRYKTWVKNKGKERPYLANHRQGEAKKKKTTFKTRDETSGKTKEETRSKTSGTKSGKIRDKEQKDKARSKGQNNGQ